MASNRLALGVLFVLLATASVNAAITNCVVYGANATIANITTEICTTCDTSFTLNTGNLSCTACPTRCSTCNLNGTCTGCISGYSLNGGVCPDCGSGCSRCGVNGCDACNSGFFLRNGGCIACSRYCSTCSSDVNCLTCNNDFDRYRVDNSDQWYCREHEHRRSAWWTFLVFAGILALLIFAICCYLSQLRQPTNVSYAPLSVSAPAYQLTTVQTRPLAPAYGVAVANPIMTSGGTVVGPQFAGPQYGGPQTVAGPVVGKTGYYGGF